MVVLQTGREQAERLRLRPGSPVPSNLDGLADDSCGQPVAVEPNVDIFMHMILLDWDHHLAMAFGDTVVVTPDGCETLSQIGTGLTIN